MATRKSKTWDLGSLRHHAEAQLRDRKLAANLPVRDPDRVVHELEVHQIELELQNEELREARVELESALARYTEIFDFSPIGYLTVTADGTIEELNHAAARFLGSVRSELVGKVLARFVAPLYRTPFSELVRLALLNEAPQSCSLQLLRSDGELFEGQLMATLLSRAEPQILLTMQRLQAASAQTRAEASPDKHST